MKSCALTAIPSAVRRTGLRLSDKVEVKCNIPESAGTILVIRVIDHRNRNNRYENSDGAIGRLLEDDALPAVLGSQRDPQRCIGDTPTRVEVGDTLAFIGVSGVVGILRGWAPSWGRPVDVGSSAV